jgi:hypothetical protein
LPFSPEKLQLSALKRNYLLNTTFNLLFLVKKVDKKAKDAFLDADTYSVSRNLHHGWRC